MARLIIVVAARVAAQMQRNKKKKKKRCPENKGDTSYSFPDAQKCGELWEAASDLENDILILALNGMTSSSKNIPALDKFRKAKMQELRERGFCD